jgi:hypothetical protein
MSDSQFPIGSSVRTHSLKAESNGLLATVAGAAVEVDGVLRMLIDRELSDGTIQSMSLQPKNLEIVPDAATAPAATATAAPTQVTAGDIASFFCPLTLEVMKDAVIDSEGHSYDRASIFAYIDGLLATSKPVLSPMTRNPMQKSDLKPNYALKSAIAEMSLALGGDGWQERSNAVATEAFGRANPLAHALKGIRTGSAVLMPDLFTHLDAFVELDLVNTLSLKRPQIVVLGNESSGKSTVLERIMGFPIFPRDKKLCTRCVIRVHLRRGITRHLAKLSVRKVVRKTFSFQGLEVDNAELESEYVPLQLLSGRVQQLMLSMVAGKPLTTVVTDKEIVVEITVPYCPDIDLVDLPGLVEDPPETAAATQQLAQGIIERESGHSIFVAVVSSTLPVNQSKAIRLLRENNLLSKAVGILTKIDVFHSDDCSIPDEEALLEALDSTVSMSMPWVGAASTVSRGYGSPSEMGHMLEMARYESEILMARFPLLLARRRVGIDIARAMLLHAFEDFLRTNWAEKIIAKLKEHWNTSISAFKSLGMPCPPQAAYGSHITALGRYHYKGIPELKLTLDFPIFRTTLVESVLAEWHKLRIMPTSSDPLWKHLSDYDKYCAEITTATMPVSAMRGNMALGQGYLRQLCARMMESFAEQSESAVVMAALLGLEPSAAAPGPVQEKAEEVPSLKFSRFANLHTSFLRHIDAANWYATFYASASEEIERRFSNFWVRIYKSEGTVNLRLTEPVQTLGHDLISMWIDMFFECIVTSLADWQFTVGDTTETTEGERVHLFSVLTDTLDALVALKKLCPFITPSTSTVPPFRRPTAKEKKGKKKY